MKPVILEPSSHVLLKVTDFCLFDSTNNYWITSWGLSAKVSLSLAWLDSQKTPSPPPHPTPNQDLSNLRGHTLLENTFRTCSLTTRNIIPKSQINVFSSCDVWLIKPWRINKVEIVAIEPQDPWFGFRRIKQRVQRVKLTVLTKSTSTQHCFFSKSQIMTPIIWEASQSKD